MAVSILSVNINSVLLALIFTGFFLVSKSLKIKVYFYGEKRNLKIFHSEDDSNINTNNDAHFLYSCTSYIIILHDHFAFMTR